MKVCEIFQSIQGESAWQGFPCLFIRVAGCNLRCRWCDTTYALEPNSGADIDVESIFNIIKNNYKVKYVELTGGEPLLYSSEVVDLVKMLVGIKKDALIETNGSIPLPEGLNFNDFRSRIHFIMDIKCPSSGMSEKNCLENLKLLSRFDNLKFVVADVYDYEYAKNILMNNNIRCEVIFMPVWKELDLKFLADWILRDNLSNGLNIRLQTQLHKIIWGDNVRGV